VHFVNPGALRHRDSNLKTDTVSCQVWKPAAPAPVLTVSASTVTEVGTKAEPADKPTWVRVQPGDTLGKLAKEHSLSVRLQLQGDYPVGRAYEQVQRLTRVVRVRIRSGAGGAGATPATFDGTGSPVG
jgi:LysM repeat protein